MLASAARSPRAARPWADHLVLPAATLSQFVVGATAAKRPAGGARPLSKPLKSLWLQHSLTVGQQGAISTPAARAFAARACVCAASGGQKSKHNPTAKKPVRIVRAPGSNTRMKTMFAVIKTGGKQYRVALEDKLQVAKVA